MRVALLGLGKMGAPIAGHLLNPGQERKKTVPRTETISFVLPLRLVKYSGMDEKPQETTGQNPEQDLASQVVHLTQRVYRLESALRARGISLEEPSPRTSVPARELAPGITHPETAPPRQQAPRPTAPPPPPQFLAQRSDTPDRSLENRIGSQ